MKEWKFGSKFKQPRCKLCGKWFHLGGAKRYKRRSYSLLVCSKCREEKDLPLINKHRVLV